MANDPVCGMYVDPSTGIVAYKDDKKYYFCSASCKVQFEKPERELFLLRVSIAISWPIAIAIVLMSYVFTSLPFEGYIMLVLASVVQFYPGWRFYAGIADAIRNRSSNMDTLIAIGTSAAFGYSAIVVLFPSLFPVSGVYFDTSTLIIALILTGTYLQRLTEAKAGSSVEKLLELKPKIAHLVSDGKTADMQTASIQTTDIPAERVKVGDALLVRPGEGIPTDGVVLEGSTTVDESMITGESMPVDKAEGDALIGGTINTAGSIRMRATKVGMDTTLSQIVSVVRDAASSRVPIQKLVDRVSSYFVPAVVAAAVISALLWFFVGGVGLTYSILALVSVLIIACPCALGIATPAALLRSSGISARNGILIKNGEALEILNKVDAVVLDKTGTLTEGKPKVTKIVPFGGIDGNEVLRMAASAEADSEHALGRAVVDEAKRRELALQKAKGFKYLPGSGIEAVLPGNRKVVVGNAEMFGVMDKASTESMAELEEQGGTVLVVGSGGNVLGLISLSDTLKEDSRKAVAEMVASGIEVWMVTGDNERAARRVAHDAGITNIIAGAKPKDKLAHIERLQKSGKKVAMVGDGINDAPALAKADVGIAIGAGTDIAMESGSVVLVKSRLSDVPKAIGISRMTIRKIRQNLFWAFGYNSVLVPVAGGALVPLFGIGMYSWLPIMAAFAMSLSSVTVVLNSLLMKDYVPRRASISH